MPIEKGYDEASDRALVRIELGEDDAQGLREALACALRAVAFPERLLRRPGASLDDLERAFTPRYELQFRRAGDLVTERAFFERCAELEALDELTLRYVRFVQGRHSRLGLDHLWHDEDHPAGCYAMVPLALRSVGHVPALTEYLLGTAPEEETIQSSVLRLVLLAHGLCDETLELLAARLGRSHGQFSQEDLRFAVAESSLAEHLSRPREGERFLDRVVREGRRAGLDPSLPLGTLAYVLGQGSHEEWRRWAALAERAHARALTLVEPGPRYHDSLGPPPRRPAPDQWDEEP